ncbi:MAG: hypothetical protein JWO71_2346 [Candidatus Acidoferrum typicum]|nr:hypothetical protein [Candidatus Acidoferrum typicum]
MPTPSSLPQRSRINLLSPRSSSPNRRSPLHIRHSPQHLLSPFRMNTCKSVSKQRTLTIFRMNTYAKPGGGGTQGYPRTLYQSGSATIDLLLLCFHTLMSCFFRKYFILITICVAPCVFCRSDEDRHPDRAQRRGTFPRPGTRSPLAPFFHRVPDLRRFSFSVPACYRRPHIARGILNVSE